MKASPLGVFSLACLGGLVIMPTGVSAQVVCPSIAPQERLTASGLAIAHWEARKAVSLSDGARALLEADICRAVSEISSQTGTPIKDIDAVAVSQITAYLDDILSDRSQFSSLSARFEMAFLLNASARLPEQRHAAIVTFVFTRTIDQIVIGAARRTPALRLVSEYGTFPYQGFRSGQRVCAGSFKVNSSLGANVRC